MYIFLSQARASAKSVGKVKDCPAPTSASSRAAWDSRTLRYNVYVCIYIYIYTHTLH